MRLRNFLQSPGEQTEQTENMENLAERSLQEMRERMHVGLLIAFAVLGFPVVLLMFLKWVPQEKWLLLATCTGVYLVAVLILIFRRRISYAMRMLIGIVVFLTLSAIMLAEFALSGAGFWFFMVFCVVNTLLYGLRVGLLSLVASLALIVPIAVFMGLGYLEFNLANALNSLSLRSWAVAITLFVMLTGSIVVAQGIIQNHLRNSLRGESRLRQKLELTNQLLREQLADLKAARRGIEESERRTRLLADHVSDIIWTADLDGRLTYVSSSAIRFHGYEPDEFTFDTWEPLLTPESAQHLADAFRRIRESPDNKPHRYLFVELDLVHKYGTIIPLEVSLARTQDPISGEPLILGVSRDISQRRRNERERESLEVQLRQAQKMEAVGQLAGGIAHDFNNLLTGITGNIEYALMELDGDDPMREPLQEAVGATVRAAGLIRQLLVFSRKQIIEPRLLNTNELIESSSRMLLRLLDESIQITIALSPDAPPILADPGQVEQILVNLAVNARDAMPSGGRLTVQTEGVYLDDEFCAAHGGEPGQYLRLSVEDTGTGMDAHVLAHLFDPFFTTKPVGKGTGLGLSTVYGAVSQHDGIVTVSSEPGRGSRFDIFFPAAKLEPDTRCPGDSPPPAAGGTERVLLVEDALLVRNAAARSLRRLGYAVTEAAHGQEALLSLREAREPFDILVTDLIMPGMSGRELAEEVARQSPGTRVLYTSGYTEDSVAIRQIISDQVPFLPKPFTPQELGCRVREVLDTAPDSR